MELFTERSFLKDILPDKAKDIAKKYKLKEDEIQFVRKNIPLKAEDLTIEDGERAAIRFVNTADIDRDNEIVLPSGIQLNDFKKSPTVLYGHNYQGLPIGKDIWIKNVPGKGILAKTVYAKHQLAEDVYNLVKEKFLNTSSIGFIPLESVNPENKGWDKLKTKLMDEYGLDEKMVDNTKTVYTKSILLEHSDVPIPSNINALNIAVGKGLKIESKELRKDLELEIIDEEKEEVKNEGIASRWTPKTKEGKEVDVDKLDKELDDEDPETHKPEPEPEEKEKQKEEQNKGFSLDEIYEIVKENKELIEKLENVTVELKAGAVLNKKNKSDLGNAQKLIQNVLDSAGTAEPTEEDKAAFNCECLECGYKMQSDEHCNTLKCPECGGEMRRAERPGPGKEIDGLEIEEQTLDIDVKDNEKPTEPAEVIEETVDISAEEIKEIVNGALNEQVDKITNNVKQEIDDNFKRITGKVM